MDSPILRSSARFLVPLMLLFSLFLLVRGHNEPGGGFVGGLVAATAFALVLLAEGRAAAERLLRWDPLAFVAGGLFLALLSGVPPVLRGSPFMTGLWLKVALPVLGKIGSPVVFDAGVYLVVVGVTCKMIFVFAKSTQGLRALVAEEGPMFGYPESFRGRY